MSLPTPTFIGQQATVAGKTYQVVALNPPMWKAITTGTTKQLLSDHLTNVDGAHDDIYGRNFKTITDLRAQTDAGGTVINLASLAGNKVFWRGYYAESDGGSNWGIVKVGNSTGLNDDGFSVFIITNDTVNGVWVEANVTSRLQDIRKAGAVPDDESKATVNSSAISSIRQKDLGIKINGKYHVNQGIPFTSGYTIKGVNSNDDWLIYAGDQNNFFIYAADLNTPAFNCLVKDISIRGETGTNTAKLINVAGIRQSNFIRVRLRNYLEGLRTSQTWYNTYKRCEFVAGGAIDGSIETIGINFIQDGSQFPITNAAEFSGVIVTGNYIGIRAESVGDAVVFNNGYTIEGNGIAVLFTGSGGCHSLSFKDGYIELNNKNFVINKTGGGDLRSVQLDNNMIGYAASGAGLLSVEVNTLNGDHRFEVTDNTFRGDVVPDSGYAFTAASQAAMLGFTLNWYRNKGQTGGDPVKPWNKDVVDWRFINSDVFYPVSLVSDANNWYSGSPLKIKVENSIAHLVGDVKSDTRAVLSATTINNLLPSSLRPAASAQFLISQYTDIDSSALQGTLTITSGGGIRLKDVASNKAQIDASWVLSADRRYSSEQPI